MDEAGGHYATYNKPEREGHTLCKSLICGIWKQNKRSNFMEAEKKNGGF